MLHEGRAVVADEEQRDRLRRLPQHRARRGDGTGVHEQHAIVRQGHRHMCVSENDDVRARFVREGGAAFELRQPVVVAARRGLLQMVRVVRVREQHPPPTDRDDLRVR